MKRALDRPLGSAALGLLLLSAAIPGAAFAGMSDKTAVSRTAEVDGVTFRYLTAGRGAPLILLHGYAETSRMWRPIIPQLASDSRSSSRQSLRNRPLNEPIAAYGRS